MRSCVNITRKGKLTAKSEEDAPTGIDNRSEYRTVMRCCVNIAVVPLASTASATQATEHDFRTKSSPSVGVHAFGLLNMFAMLFAKISPGFCQDFARVCQDFARVWRWEGLQIAPWRDKIDHRRVKNRAQIARGTPKSSPIAFKTANFELFSNISDKFWKILKPKNAQERPKSARERPRAPQERPKSVLREPQ